MADIVIAQAAETTDAVLREDTQDDAAESRSVGKPASEMELDTEPSTETAAAEDETVYPTGTKFTIIMLSVGLALIIGGMDASIVAVAVPALSRHFHTIRDIGWYSSAYRLCMCSFQFMFGKLYKLFAFKMVFLASMTIFVIGSVLTATAQTSPAFIFGRAVCGLACAGVISGCFTSFRIALPLRKRPLYSAVFAGIEGIAVMGSPLIGGVLVEKLGWRWCFWINVPTGALTWCMIAIWFPSDLQPATSLPLKQKLKELDLPGTILFFPAITSLFMALTWAGSRLPWSSPTIIALFCVFVVLLAVFAIEQWLKQDTATLPPRLLSTRSVLAGAVFSMCCNGMMNVFEYYLPTYLQAVRGYSPSQSGYLCLPLVIAFLLSMLVQGAGVGVVGYFVPFMLAGSILMPIGAGLMTTLTLGSSLAKFIGLSFFLGFAGGIGFQAPQVAVQNTLSEADSHMGLAVILFAQAFGPAVFVAAAQNVLTGRLVHNLEGVSPSLNTTKIESMGLSDFSSSVGPNKLREVLSGLDKSIMQTWYLGIGLACVTMIGSVTMPWKYIKQKRS